MTQFSHHKTVLLAMEEAVRRGRPDIAADILSAHPTVRAYVRAPSSPLGMQRKPWDGPFPKATKYIVIVNFEPLGDGKGGLKRSKQFRPVESRLPEALAP
jgi:hypothetical protein